MQQLNVSAFDAFHTQWALLTAGTPEDYNTMTISWGGLGTLWSRPTATVYVKPIRYTYRYMERHAFFTVSFFPPEYREDLTILGSRSGRDGDKVALTRLTPKPAGEGVTFAEAHTTLLCRKIYRQDLDSAAVPPDVAAQFYAAEAPHRMYIGEVLSVLQG